MLVRFAAEEDLPNTMRLFKGITARDVFLAFQQLRFDMGSLSFWQKTYGRRQIPEDQLELMRNYILNQLDRPLRHAD
jgi:hypothetical protein